MPSTFSGFYISLRGMQAQQMALQTAAHNIANAETQGFSRQRAILAVTPPWPEPSVNSSGMVGQIGTGVEVTYVERMRDEYLDIQLRKEYSNLGEWSIKQDTLEQVETIFQEPTDTGLNNLLTQFWDAWLELSMNPESTTSAVRTTVAETSASLADALRHTSQQLDSISGDLDSIIEIKVLGIKTLANQISHLNDQIKKIKTVGFEPNDLMDQRDLLLDELSQIIDFKIEYNLDADENPDGTINVNLYNTGTGDYDSRLVDGIVGRVNALTTGKNMVTGKLEIRWEEYLSTEPAAPHTPAAGDVLEASSGIDHYEISSGELKGLLDARDNLLDQYRIKLNTFAENLINQVNAQHAMGYDLNGGLGLPFFTGNNASDIQVNPAIVDDVFLIAAAATADGVPGDGSNALAISELRNAEGVCAGSSFNDYYRNLIAGLGVDTNEAQRMTTNQEALVGQLETRKESISGVSIDEELAHMVEHQHIYNASARLLSTLDEMLETLIMRMAW